MPNVNQIVELFSIFAIQEQSRNSKKRGEKKRQKYLITACVERKSIAARINNNDGTCD